MKKKLIILLMVAILAPTMIFASNILQLGVNVGYAPTLKTLTNSPETSVKDYFKMEYFSFAPELKLNIFCVDLDVVAAFSLPEDARIQIDTDIAADLYCNIAFLKLFGGIGVKMPFKLVGHTWTMGDAVLGEDSAGDVLLNSQLSYRAGAGFDMGRFNLMINYTVPTNGTFKNIDLKPDWDNGKFSIGLLYDLF